MTTHEKIEWLKAYHTLWSLTASAQINTLPLHDVFKTFCISQNLPNSFSSDYILNKLLSDVENITERDDFLDRLEEQKQ